MKNKSSMILVVLIGLALSIFVWFKNNIGTIIGKASGEAINTIKNDNSVSLKEALRNASSQAILGASDGLYDKARNGVSNLFNRNRK